MTFAIDADNNVTAYAGATAPDGAELKLSEPHWLRKGTRRTRNHLAGGRLVEMWNGLRGVTSAKKSTDRMQAVTRIWKAVQSLVPLWRPTR